MRRLLLVPFLLALAWGQTTAPTKPALEQIKSATGFTGVVVLVNGTFMVAQLSPSVMIDTSGPQPVIRAVPVLPMPTEEEFSPATGQVAFTLAGTPMVGTLEVFRNGIRMRVGRDFSITAKVVTFTAQPVAIGDLIVARYWPGG
jgi:hypothetical protein